MKAKRLYLPAKKRYLLCTFCMALLLFYAIFLAKKGHFGTFFPQSVMDHMPWWAHTEIFPERTSDVPYYTYNMLPDDQKRLYDDMYSAINHYSSALRTNTLSEHTIRKVYEAIRADHAEIYWIDGFTLRKHTVNDKITHLDFVPQYTMGKKAAVTYAKKIRQCANNILHSAPISGSNYQKSKWVYEYLSSNMTYNREAADNQNILSSLLHQESACRGYSSAAQYLLRELGIESVIIVGSLNQIPHAWNMVKLDGDFYYMDTTLSQSYFDNTDDKEPIIDYSYLNITTQELLVQHTIDVSFLLPDCTKDSANYYVAENRYLTSYDENTINDIILSAYKSGQQYVSVKFSSTDLYQAYHDYLNRNMSRIMPAGNYLYLFDNPSLSCVTIEIG